MIAVDAPVTWPQKGRGGYYRNQDGYPIVSHPDGSNRTLMYDGASDLIPSPPYRGDPIYGARGTHIHTIIGIVERREELDDQLIADGEALGIPEALQRHIATDWHLTRQAHGITTYPELIEQPAVHDGWRVATNVDLPDRMPDGSHRGGDAKTSSNPIRTDYQLQLAVVPGSVMYDPDTGQRTPWPWPIDPNIGNLWWYPLTQAIACEPGHWPSWTLIEVDLRHGHMIGNQLAAMKHDKARTADFCYVATPTQIAAPVTSPTVEPAATGKGGAPAGPALPVALPTPAEQRAAIPTNPDEGPPITDADYEALRARYMALGKPTRTVTYARLVEQAMQAGVSFHLSDGRTVRRFEIARGLVLLAAHDSLDDDTVRALLYANDLHGEAALYPSVTVGHLVGALDARQAANFAARCHQLVDGQLTATVDDDGQLSFVEAA